MSMIGCFYSLEEQDLGAITEQPERLTALWAAERGTAIGQEAPKPTIFSRLFGAKSSPKSSPASPPWKPSQKAEYFDVDKAWHGIHFLLTGRPDGGSGPLAFMLEGGREIKKELGYGPPHAFTSAEVKEIARALQGVNVDELYSKAETQQFASNDIYPSIWDEPKEECIGYVRDYLAQLKDFVVRTAESNRALIVYLS